MPVIDNETESPVPFTHGDNPVKETQPNIVSPDVESNLIDTERLDPAHILVHIGGSRWTINYYSQVLAKGDQPQHYNPNQPAPYQQYISIDDMMIMVDEPLTPSFDSELNKATLVGAATVFPYVKVNNGDPFVADIGNGRLGLFGVTAVTMNSIFAARAHRITYKLLFLLDDQKLASLNEKVVKKTFFKRDFLRFGQNPLLVEEDVDLLRRLNEHESGLLHRFMHDFFKPRNNTLLLDIISLDENNNPFIYKSIYDPFVTYAISSITNIQDHPLLPKIRVLNIEGGSISLSKNIWTALIRSEFGSFSYLDRYMKVISQRNFASNPSLASVFWIKEVDGVMYPVNRNPYDDRLKGVSCATPLFDELPDELGEMILGKLLGSFDGDLPPEEVSVEELVADAPLYHPVNKDMSYVLSEYFYNKDPYRQSKLELLTNQYIAGQPLEPRELLRICDDVVHWGNNERFYYIPLLLILIKVTKRTM